MQNRLIRDSLKLIITFLTVLSYHKGHMGQGIQKWTK